MGGMLGKLNTFSLLGIDALPVEVEVDASPGGLPKMALFGLPDAAVKESAQETQVSRELAKFEGLQQNGDWLRAEGRRVC
jgi:magnesium chelatase family protein